MNKLKNWLKDKIKKQNVEQNQIKFNDCKCHVKQNERVQKEHKRKEQNTKISQGSLKKHMH